MGLFTKARPVTRQDIVNWCGNQMGRRAESLDAQQVASTAQRQHGLSPSEVLYKFVDSQWEIVVRECVQHFGQRRMTAEQARDAFTDMRGIEAAVREAGQALYPIHQDAVVDVIATYRQVATDSGWRMD